MDDLRLADFPLITFDKVRYVDTDCQGHVNNSAFSTFLETGRVEFLYNKDFKLLNDGASFVIASLNLKFLNEIVWPGTIDIGTGIVNIGSSSVKIFQQLYQNEKCVASAETIIVQTKNNKSVPLNDSAKEILKQWLIKA
jgi:acyl-CoA thioester hydrolase